MQSCQCRAEALGGEEAQPSLDNGPRTSFFAKATIERKPCDSRKERREGRAWLCVGLKVGLQKAHVGRLGSWDGVKLLCWLGNEEGTGN